MIESHESTTAKLCSFARAYHSTYARKKIFDDSLAFDFMGLEQYEETGQLIGHNYQENLIDPNLSFHSSEIVDKLNHYLMPIPISRIAFAEQELTSFAGCFPLCQYVICGAGMDTFMRSAWLRLFRSMSIPSPLALFPMRSLPMLSENWSISVPARLFSA